MILPMDAVLLLPLENEKICAYCSERVVRKNKGDNDSSNEEVRLVRGRKERNQEGGIIGYVRDRKG